MKASLFVVLDRVVFELLEQPVLGVKKLPDFRAVRIFLLVEIAERLQLFFSVFAHAVVELGLDTQRVIAEIL